MDLGLSGKTVLITGGYRGTGAGIAAVMAAEGASVLVHGFEAGQPDEAVASIQAAGGTAAGVVADLSTNDGAAGLDDVAATVDILVNNYGAPVGSSWNAMDRWASEWDTNVLSAVRATQRCIPGMRDRRWGRIVYLGTVGSRKPGPQNPGYYGAKAALHAVVRTLAMELKGTGVTANLVSPALIATPEMREMMTRRATKAGAADDWESVQAWALEHTMGNLIGRIPNPADIGKVVAFVASEAAWPINGADIAVDGGAVDA